MSTFIYAPSIEAHIATLSGAIYDVSADISTAQVSRSIGISTVSLTLTNANRKYDGVFTPMDRIVIYLTRTKRLLIFSGYLDSVPLFTTFPGSVALRASCSLKRLQQFLWDPHSSLSVSINGPMAADGANVTDGGIAKRATDLLVKVANWPASKIHIADVPVNWFNQMSKITDTLVKQSEVASMISTVGIGSMGGMGPGTVTGMDITIPGIGTGTGTIPGGTGYGLCSWFGGPKGAAYGGMALTGEPGGIPDSQRAKWGGAYYCAMRWQYAILHSHGATSPAPGAVRGAPGWWAKQRLLVTNSRTHKAVVVRPADWGPGIETRIIDLSEPAFNAIGAHTDDPVYVCFAPAGMAVGPVAGDYGKTAKAIGPTLGSDPRTKLVAFGHWLQSQGFNVGEHPDFGVVHRVHATNSLHYVRGAIDVNYDGHAVSEKTKIDSIASLARSKYGLRTIWQYPGHYNHIHFDISTGPDMGNVPKTSSVVITDPTGTTPTPTTAAAAPTTSDPNTLFGDALFNVFQQLGQTEDEAGTVLFGVRALMNDVPLYPTIDDLMNSGLRQWCSAPNGDIIAWFPDYFGHWGTAAKMIIQDVEIEEPFTVAWSDDHLKTHMFVTGATVGNENFGDATTVFRQSATAGIASVEIPELMAAMFNVDVKTFADNGVGFLNRYGARTDNFPMDTITGARQEFFFACFRFMQNWSEQYSCNVSMTFMPELYPGMLAVFPRYGVQAYVSGVNHSIDMSNGGGFTTQANLTAWSTIGKQPSIKGLPRGGAL